MGRKAAVSKTLKPNAWDVFFTSSNSVRHKVSSFSGINLMNRTRSLHSDMLFCLVKFSENGVVRFTPTYEIEGEWTPILGVKKQTKQQQKQQQANELNHQKSNASTNWIQEQKKTIKTQQNIKKRSTLLQFWSDSVFEVALGLNHFLVCVKAKWIAAFLTFWNSRGGRLS